jgi:hypothetical protein
MHEGGKKKGMNVGTKDEVDYGDVQPHFQNK